jgi:ribosome-binding protein aMBF1 (putative translation factor)
MSRSKNIRNVRLSRSHKRLGVGKTVISPSLPVTGNSPPDAGRRLGAVARRLCEEHGLTLADVAAQAGISAGMLSRLDTGHVTPSFETLVALAAALGVRLAIVAG